MTNAVGYYHYEREERIAKDHPDFKANTLRTQSFLPHSADINRDFPYNIDSDQCLNTIAGRVVHELFTQNLIVSAITFHGGINVIGYPWGSYNHVKRRADWTYISREAPDLKAFEGVGWAMKNASGGVIKQG